jgi:hypothetical protein
MVDITRIHIHFETMNKKKSVKKIKPTDPTNKLSIKHDIGEALQRFKATSFYYFVVLEIDQDGQPAYRTVIPKTLVSR